MKIVFFGTSDFAVPALRILHDNNYEIPAVVTVPDKPVGRKKILTAPPAKLAALELGISVHQPASLKKAKPRSDAPVSTTGDEQFFELFKSWQADICVIASYGKIIPERYLEIPKYGFINIHPSLLPKYRGPSPIQTAILNGESKTGVTIMVIDKDMDHGPIIAQKEYAIAKNKYYKEIESELSVMGANLLFSVIPGYIDGKIKPAEQNHKKATFTKMLSREDGKISWRNPARKIFNKIHALNPEPGTWTTWPARRSLGEGGKSKTLNILKAEEMITNLNKEKTPGMVVALQKSVAVKTETCFINLISVQLEGSKEMDAKSFVNGHPDFIGSLLE